MTGLRFVPLLAPLLIAAADPPKLCDRGAAAAPMRPGGTLDLASPTRPRPALTEAIPSPMRAPVQVVCTGQAPVGQAPVGQAPVTPDRGKDDGAKVLQENVLHALPGPDIGGLEQGR